MTKRNNKTGRTKPWTVEEDAVILTVEYAPLIPISVWDDIAKRLSTRTAAACKDRHRTLRSRARARLISTTEWTT